MPGGEMPRARFRGVRAGVRGRGLGAIRGADQDRHGHISNRRARAQRQVGAARPEIWEEDINAKGGLLGRPVKLIYYDDYINPASVPGIYTKLLDVDKVDLIIGGYGT